MVQHFARNGRHHPYEHAAATSCDNSDAAGETAGKLLQNVPSLLDDILIARTETFGELFEPLPPRHEEYIDPAFRIIRTKKRKKKHQIKP